MDKLDELIQPEAGKWIALKQAVAEEIHCALPGIVQRFDPAARTADILPALRGRRGGGVWENLPLLLDVPVYFPGGQGLSLSYPVAPGDECLVIFADGCVDAWLAAGGAQNPVNDRRHSLSDGFALVGFHSLQQTPPPLPEGVAFALQVRTQSGWKTALSVDAAGVATLNPSED